MEGCGVCVGRGGLLSSPQVLGQLLRKDSRARRAMKVVLRLWGNDSPRAWTGGPKWQGSKEEPGV